MGSDFAVDGESVGYGQLTGMPGDYWAGEPGGRLTGILASGDLLDNDFYIFGDSRIVLVPEPATVLLLGLGAVMVKKKR